jgi:UDP-N-acetylmuramoylalanine--D-glutamate ligase
MMSWKNQRVLMIGVARQGMALARYLVSRGSHVILNDHRTETQLQDALQSLAGIPVEWILGEHPLDVLDDIDLVCVSGGVPLSLPIVVEAVARGIPLSNDSQIFMEVAPCSVIGITGSAGKTTTTSLVGQMAAHSAKDNSRVWVGGNIGNPLISSVDEISGDDLVVMELSSFQLDQMTISPQVAVVLNITPNHLDRHGNMQAYTAAKRRILDYQGAADKAVLGRDDPGAWGLVDSLRGDLISFGLARPPKGQRGTFLQDGWIKLWDRETALELISQNSIPLRGEHNLYNVLAACAIAIASDLSIEAIQSAVAEFAGVPHRLEFVRSWGGADWYNDSIATAPERAMAAINSFDEPLVLLLGGRDKDLPWEDLAQLVCQRVDHLVIFGEAAELIAQAVSLAGPAERPYSVKVCPRLEDAVIKAAEAVEPGSVVLLAPGGTSFDEFIDFAERGERFRKWVNELN